MQKHENHFFGRNSPNVCICEPKHCELLNIAMVYGTLHEYIDHHQREFAIFHHVFVHKPPCLYHHFLHVSSTWILFLFHSHFIIPMKKKLFSWEIYILRSHIHSLVHTPNARGRCYSSNNNKKRRTRESEKKVVVELRWARKWISICLVKFFRVFFFT